MLVSILFDVFSSLHTMAPGGNGILGGAAVSTGLAGVCAHLRQSRSELKCRCAYEARLRHELAAYVVLDFAAEASAEEFARQVSRTVATRSSFARAALLLRNAEDHLVVMGSAGMDDLSVQALNRWGAEAVQKPHGAQTLAPAESRVGRSSFALQLERRVDRAQEAISKLGCALVYVIPMHSKTGLIGALVVCSDARKEMQPAKRPTLGGWLAQPVGPTTEELLEPLEALALRLAVRLQETREAAGRKKLRLLNRVSEPAPASWSAPTSRRSLDESDAPSLSGIGKISPRRLVEIVNAGHAGSSSYGTSGVSGFPPVRLWAQSLPHGR